MHKEAGKEWREGKSEWKSIMRRKTDGSDTQEKRQTRKTYRDDRKRASGLLKRRRIELRERETEKGSREGKRERGRGGSAPVKRVERNGEIGGDRPLGIDHWRDN